MKASDEKLSCYPGTHGRAPAFEGTDGRAYSVGVFSDDDPGADGRFGASLLFIRWSQDQQPDGHLETAYLAFAMDPLEAEAQVAGLTLSEIKAHLDRLIAGKAGK